MIILSVKLEQCEKLSTFNAQNVNRLNGRSLQDNFNAQPRKGKGGFGEVRIIQYENYPTAVKKVELSEINNRDFDFEYNLLQSEIKYLKKFSNNGHNHSFPNFYGCAYQGYNVRNRMTTYVIQEALYSDLSKNDINERFIANTTPLERMSKYRDLYLGLKVMHDAGYAHQDLKPENIMAKDRDFSTIKVIDLGMVCRIGRSSFGGTALYNSPEKISNGRCVASDDIWAMTLTIANIEAKREYIFKNMAKTCFKNRFSTSCLTTLKSNIEPVLKKVFGTKSSFRKELVKTLEFNSTNIRPTADNIIAAIDKDSNPLEIQQNENMSSRHNHRRDFNKGNEDKYEVEEDIRKTIIDKNIRNQEYRDKLQKKLEKEIAEMKNKIIPKGEGAAKNYEYVLHQNHDLPERPQFLNNINNLNPKMKKQNAAAAALNDDPYNVDKVDRNKLAGINEHKIPNRYYGPAMQLDHNNDYQKIVNEEIPGLKEIVDKRMRDMRQMNEIRSKKEDIKVLEDEVKELKKLQMKKDNKNFEMNYDFIPNGNMIIAANKDPVVNRSPNIPRADIPNNNNIQVKRKEYKVKNRGNDAVKKAQELVEKHDKIMIALANDRKKRLAFNYDNADYKNPYVGKNNNVKFERRKTHLPAGVIANYLLI